MQDAAPQRRRGDPTSLTGARLWLMFVLLCGALAAVQAGELAVIANPATAAPRDQRSLIAIYRGELRVDDAGRRVVPLNLPGDNPLRRAFSLALFGRPPEDFEAFWNERYFHGISPPYVVSSVEAMLRFVATTPGAIGYVPRCAVDDRVRVVATLPSEALPAACRGAGR